MRSIQQVGSVLCGIVLLLNVSQAAAMQAPNDLTHNRTIMGDVTRVEHAYYFVREKDGTEVRLHADKTTLMLGQLKQGDRVEAEVTEQNHALLMRSLH
ncbi:MAG TPA: hypothetical protein VE222_11660 [Nitrospiraceae bacterium]|nr:hypothetical protein [Nitrospiraceae bacterium]